MIQYQYVSEKVRLADQIFHDLEKWGVKQLPTLEAGKREVIHTSPDKTILLSLVATGHKQGYFLLRQESPGGMVYHLRSEEFKY